MPRKWRIAAFDEPGVRGLAAGLGVGPVLAQVLWARGYESPEQARRFLDSRLTDLCDPELLPGVSAAADRIVAAVRDRRRIVIYGDYDADGVTATSLLWHCLRLLGGEAGYYIPHRVDEGYGLHAEALRAIHAEDPRTLVVTVDCGITSVAEARLARELGLELIVTDHHQQGLALPAADGLVHPRLPGSTYPFGELCGAGVAFKLAWALCTRLGDGRKASPRMREFLLQAVGLAAIGTVADVVPLTGENRVLVRYGLHSLRERCPPGLQALIQATKLHEKPALDAEDVAFTLAPRINAAGRLGQARLAVELLTTDNPDRAALLAAYLEEQNKARQTVERRMLKQARELIDARPDWLEQPALVVSSGDWHSGVIGIVAGKVAEHYQKPAILIAVNGEERVGHGSARSFAGYDLHAGLTACGERLLSYGGHQAAAGLRVAAEQIDAFREAFCAHVAGNLTLQSSDLELAIDAEIRLADLGIGAIRDLERLGPFGRGNPRPVLACTRVELAEPPRKMGEGERHLALRVRHYGKVLRAVAFGRGEWAEPLAAQTAPFSICFAPQINHYAGRESVELRLADWQPAESRG